MRACRSREAVRRDTAQQIADPEPGHERGHDERGGVHVGAGKEHQNPLPDDLIQQRREPGKAERDERGGLEGAITH